MKIGEKTFMNLQEAVAWLLENNPLPFQSSANYAGNTEIAFSTLINPSPAKVRVGSIIFFADSKVSTVIGLTSNSFICSDQYNNLVDDIAYVTGVSIDGSGHLITTLSDGQSIDAGVIKQIDYFSIDASQHLIAHYNSGPNTDLGAIFQGNINIAGNFTADSIIENMTGYNFYKSEYDSPWTKVYAGCCKNGNKITFVVFGSITISGTTPSAVTLGSFRFPSEIGSKLYPYTVGGITDVLTEQNLLFADSSDLDVTVTGRSLIRKHSNEQINISIRDLDQLTSGKTYFFRIEATFLLSDNLGS